VWTRGARQKSALKSLVSVAACESVALVALTHARPRTPTSAELKPDKKQPQILRKDKTAAVRVIRAQVLTKLGHPKVDS
jgi:hypothetical protein